MKKNKSDYLFFAPLAVGFILISTGSYLLHKAGPADVSGLGITTHNIFLYRWNGTGLVILGLIFFFCFLMRFFGHIR
jgi:hypothetical protein